MGSVLVVSLMTVEIVIDDLYWLIFWHYLRYHNVYLLPKLTVMMLLI